MRLINILFKSRVNAFTLAEVAEPRQDMVWGIKAAFTLAEVLITLAIIGIVAALTIPTLVQVYKKKVVETKLQKVYSVMNQAIKLSTIDNGETYTWDTLGDSASSQATYEDIKAWYEKYLEKYIKVSKIEDNGSSALNIYLQDGSMLSFANYIYDITYYPNPNKCNDFFNKPDTCRIGVDYFMLRFRPNYIANNPNPNVGLTTYSFHWDGTYNGAKHTDNNTFGCYDTGLGAGHLCAKLIELNGWKIPDDYPYKF